MTPIAVSFLFAGNDGIERRSRIFQQKNSVSRCPELGVVARDTKDPKAMAKLCDLLASDDNMVRYPAYAYLRALTDQPGVAEAVTAFENDPGNAHIVERLREREAAAAVN